MIKITAIAMFFSLSTIWLRGEDLNSTLSQSVRGNPPVVGSVLVMKTDFSVYRVQVGTRKKPTYFYQILPSPETGIGGWELAYLGRIPSGSKLQIVDIKKGRWGEGNSYWVRVLLPYDQSLKKIPTRKEDIAEENIYSRTFKLRRTASKEGAYVKGRYPNGNPRLNEMWLTVSDENELK